MFQAFLSRFFRYMKDAGSGLGGDIIERFPAKAANFNGAHLCCEDVQISRQVACESPYLIAHLSGKLGEEGKAGEHFDFHRSGLDIVFDCIDLGGINIEGIESGSVDSGSITSGGSNGYRIEAAIAEIFEGEPDVAPTDDSAMFLASR